MQWKYPVLDVCSNFMGGGGGGGVTEQNVSHSPKYLRNWMTHYDKCILI